MTSPLHCASEKGRIDAMHLLIDAGANINEKDNWEWTSLHYALWNGHTNAMQLLKDHGARVN
jgi:ankyrin repeat protein